MALNKQKMTVLILVALVALVVIAKYFLFPVSLAQDVDPLDARAKGPDTAKVKIVEFIDLECPACANGARILKDYLAKYPNDVHVQIKYFPLMNVHRHALQVASYAECVSRQGKFWPFFDVLMPAQSQWTQLINAEGIFDQMAQGAGVDMGRLKSCLDDKSVTTAIMNEKSVGQSMGVQSTPTYFINGQLVVGTRTLEEELNKYLSSQTKQ